MSLSRRNILISVAAAGALSLASASAQTAAERLRIVISDGSSMSYVAFGDPQWSQAGAGQRLDLPVRNTSRRERVIEYRIEWFDDGGRPLPAGPAWQTLFLGPQEEAHITSVSAYRGAHAVRCTVRPVAT